MIDLHCHILPGVDDGADCLATSLNMARMAWAQGTDLIVATPHCCRPDQSQRLSPAALADRLEALNRALRDDGSRLKVLPGMEVFATPELPTLLDRGELASLAGSRYLLVEFFFPEAVDFMEFTFSTVVEHGLVPVVAHPERYAAVQANPELAADWFRRGVIVQLNKGSVLGQLGSGAKKTAWWLLRHGFAHVIASDAHTAFFRNSGLAHVRETVSNELSWRYAQILLEENPRCIVQDLPVIPVEEG